MKETNFIINRSLTDYAPRELIINKDFLMFEDKDFANDTFTTFGTDQIVAYRFGVKWQSFYFVFSREYCIEVKNTQNKSIKINFKTYFGRKKHEYHELCNAILTSLWQNYFKDIELNCIQKYEKGEEFTIGEVTFLPEGIIIQTNSSIKLKNALIPWEKVRTKNYATYFAIYAVDKAATTNRGYTYLTDWNTSVLRNVITTILQSKNIE